MYLLIAILVLGTLIFFHELGHYFMARHVGMRVEVFGIGFGKSIYRWIYRGVEWRLNWIPFGGYVKIKGTEEEENDPYTIADGFFGRPPIDRIKVSLAGPLTNLAIAFITFTALWLMGGRDKPYSEFSDKIGFVDESSPLYLAGIRAGDEVTYYGDRPFTSSKDHVYEALTADESVRIRGFHENYFQHTAIPYDITAKVYAHPLMDKSYKTLGIEPASYLIYQSEKSIGEKENLLTALSKGSPLKESGIQDGDRVVWANGELIFSQPQLSTLINDKKALVTIRRGEQLLLRRAPRVIAEELRLEANFKEEVGDWLYEAGLKHVKSSELYILPYNLTSDAEVESTLAFIDADSKQQFFPSTVYSHLEEPLKAGDKIIAIDGEPIDFAYQLLFKLQQPKALMIVSKADHGERLSIPQINREFFKEIDFGQLQQLIGKIGQEGGQKSVGHLTLLQPITPKPLREFATTSEIEALYEKQLQESRKQIEEMSDLEKRTYALELLNKSMEKLHLGPPVFLDKQVVYNPDPLTLFANVFEEIWRTLKAFITGSLSPKFISGPIGLVSTIQQTWAVSIKEGIYWLGVVSLNLGFLNLMPVPVLDGGSILFSLFEWITGTKIKIKTLEKLIVPFAVLLIVFFLFLTYNDLSRLVVRILG